jgi:hypothetical protein
MIAFTVPCVSQQASDWSKRTFFAASDEVFRAALASLSSLHYEVQEKSDESKTVHFRVGKSAFSWGYIMKLQVLDAANNSSLVSAEVSRLRGPGPNGKVSLVASGKKEIQKVFQEMDKQLTKEAKK